MNLHRPNANESIMTANRSRHVAPQSGICSRCIDGCRGNCDLFNATFRGRELLYPGENPLPGGIPVRSIEILYPAGRLNAFGLGLHWLVAYFVLSIIFGFAFKGVFKVEI